MLHSAQSRPLPGCNAAAAQGSSHAVRSRRITRVLHPYATVRLSDGSVGSNAVFKAPYAVLVSPVTISQHSHHAAHSGNHIVLSMLTVHAPRVHLACLVTSPHCAPVLAAVPRYSAPANTPRLNVSPRPVSGSSSLNPTHPSHNGLAASSSDAFLSSSLDVAPSSSSTGSANSRPASSLEHSPAELHMAGTASAQHASTPQQPAAGTEAERLWWIEKFEARRLAEAAATSAVAAGSGVEASNASSRPATTSTASQHVPATPAWLILPMLLSGLVQAALLLLSVSALILWPASLVEGGLSTAKVWLIWLSYLAFFAGGSVTRILVHGALAPSSADKQQATLGSRSAQAAFIVALPVLHWAAMTRFLKLELLQPNTMTTLSDVLGAAGIMGAIFLNVWAALHLGKAYDRVTAPARIVTTGPYRHVQHPIYVSYILLFMGYALALHSAPLALAMLAVCSVYYKGRTVLEQDVLAAAHGEQYLLYAKRTKAWMPFLL